MRPKTTFEQLFEKVDSIVKFYRSDLGIDREMIEKNPNTPFIHAARDTGTYLILMIAAIDYPPVGQDVPYIFGSADRDHLLRGKVCTVKVATEDGATKAIHYFDGSTLKQINPDEAIAIITGYEAQIKRSWSAMSRDFTQTQKSDPSVLTEKCKKLMFAPY